MNGSRTFSEKCLSSLVVVFAATVFLVPDLFAQSLDNKKIPIDVNLPGTAILADNPASDTTSTGQVLTVNIISPLDGSTFPGPPPCPAAVDGLITISDQPALELKILYVVDISGTTADPSVSGLDVNRDGVVNDTDDANSDGVIGNIEDGALIGLVALNDSIPAFVTARVGVIAFATNAISTKVTPSLLEFTEPDTDEDGNDISDVEEVLRSLDADFIEGGSIGLFEAKTTDDLGNSTNYQAALVEIIATLQRNRIAGEACLVFFVSDGENEGDDFQAELEQARALGIVINTVGTTNIKNTQDLERIAQGTGGNFIRVEDPTELINELPNLPPPVEIANSFVKVNEGNEQGLTLDAFGVFSTEVTIPAGIGQISATGIATDETVVTASILVACSGQPPVCDAGADTAICAGDSVQIGGNPTGDGGSGTLSFLWSPADGLSSTSDPNPIASPAATTDYIVTVTDSLGQSCSDTVTVTVHPNPVADAGPDVSVRPAEAIIIGGSPTASDGTPPYTFSWSPTDGLNDPAIANPEASPSMTTSYTVTVTDANGCTDIDEVEVNVQAPPPCDVNINTPEDGAIICADSVLVKAYVGVISNLLANCEINGIETTVDSAGQFYAVVPLQPGDNEIIASCTLTDTVTNQSVVCSDTISVFSDPTPPVCELDFSNFPTITGKVSDPESGIDFIEVVEISNRVLKIAGMEITDLTTIDFDGETEIEFVLEKIDVNERGTFTLRAVNSGGCEVSCDPIDLTLSPANSPCNFNFSLPHTDRYLHVENYGLNKIDLVLNGKPFSLIASENGLTSEINSYSIPGYGAIAFDLSRVLVEGDNTIQLVCQGPTGSYADILIADFLREEFSNPEIMEFQEVVVPGEFALLQNYPNPFNPETSIRFDIPESLIEGVEVKLHIYNLLGQLIQTLVDEHKLPGQYTAKWDGRDRRGEFVSSGIYVYQLVAGDFKRTKRMVFLK